MSLRRGRSGVRLVAGLMVVLAAAGSGIGGRSAAAGTVSGQGVQTVSDVQYSTVARAVPDECWVPPADPSVATDYGHYVAPTGHDSSGGVICPAGSQPKVNQAYVWGLTRAGDNLYFGTAPNVLCLVLGGYLGMTTPMYIPGNWTCEFGQSPTAKLGVPAIIGDWRPSNLYEYNMTSKSLVDLVSAQSTANAATLKALLAKTLGIRSAGSAVNPLNPAQTVIFFAGPALSTTAGVNVFAFDQNGKYLASTTLPGYDNVRKWLTVPAAGNLPNRLYVGVDFLNNGQPYGQILKWAPTSGNLFNFTVAGTTKSDVAELAAAGDRIYATTWPNAGNQAGLYVSPVSPTAGVPDGGLNGQAWTEIWQAGNYEPDPITAATYGGGALAVYGGYVYWGTMHVPFVAAEAHIASQTASQGSTPSTLQILADVTGSQRAISIFRIPVGATSSSQTQLLYGDTKLLAYQPGTASWKLVPNNMGGAEPLYGPSGFGNPFNNYTWTMSVFGNQLYVGTMDWSYLIAQGWPELTSTLGLPSGLPNPFALLSKGYGADLWRFPDATSPAQAVSVDGLGNPLNYGVRNMLSVQNGTAAQNGLYLGMANPMNLATSGPNLGGWNLIRLTPVPGPTPPPPPAPAYGLILVPHAQTLAVNSTATVTAVVVSNGQAQAGVTVTFTIASGPGAGKTAQVKTDSYGQAVFTWTGKAPGTDTVNATTPVGNGPVTVSDTASVAWVGNAPATSGQTGYVMATADGRVFAFGTGSYGSPAGLKLAAPIVGITRTPSGNGYWLVASDGGVFAYGDARFYGSTGNVKLAAPIVGMTRTPDGHGYWLVASDGGVFAYGDARFYGSTGNVKLAAPVVDIVSTSTGQGYWLVARDGGVFSFGHAVFHGSLAVDGSRVVSAGATADSGGYWMVGADGHVYSFGDAARMGSVGNLSAPIVAMDVTPSGGGYVLAGADGGVFNFGDSAFRGSAANQALTAPVVHIADR